MSKDSPFPVKGTIEVHPDYAYHDIPCEDHWLTEGDIDFLRSAKERVEKKYGLQTETRVIWRGSDGECTGYAIIGPEEEVQVMVSEGEVYYDHTFDAEIIILSVDSDQTVINGPVDDSELRTTDTWRIEHNISVGRYEKLRKMEVQNSEIEAKQEKTSIFDY